MSDNDELITRFIEVTGCEGNVAKFYLTASNWSLEDALSNFLSNQSDGDTGVSNDPSESGAVSMDSSESTPPQTAKAKTDSESTKKEAQFQNVSSTKPRFATLSDMSKRVSSDEEGQAFYAGGSEHSGQQVLGPPKRKNFREQLTDFFRMAQEQNMSEEAPPVASTSSNSSNATNWGQGMRLGMTQNDHQALPSAAGENNKKNDESRPSVVLKLWSRGFSIDDGDLRLYDDPENKEFLETVMRGEIPQELLKMGWMVNVDIEDYRHEEFKKITKPKTFKGAGHTLGSPAPNVVEEEPVSNKASPEKLQSDTVIDTKETEKLAKEKLALNAGSPTTTLQIRLVDGTRLAAQFNLTHTVADIQHFIQNARPQYASQNFVLVSSFPTRELTDQTATIESAGLKNAAVMQRLK